MNSVSVRNLFCALLGKNKSNSLSLSNSTNELTTHNSSNNTTNHYCAQLTPWKLLTASIIFLCILFVVVYFIGIISFPSVSSASALTDSNSSHGQSSEEIDEMICLKLNADCSSINIDKINCCRGLECQMKASHRNSLPQFRCQLPKPSTTTAKPVVGECPFKQQIGQILEPIKSGTEFDESINYYENSKSNYINLAAFRGNPTKNYLLTIRDLNLETRKHYAATVEKIGKNIYPLIIAKDVEEFNGLSGVGGTFTLYLEDGSSKTIQPTSPEYEIRKSLSHIPLGIFSILVPYFNGMEVPNWRSPLRLYYEKIKEALAASYLAKDIDPSSREDGIMILNQTKSFLENLLQSRSIPNGILEFEKYTDDIFYYIEKNIRRAAELQVSALLPALKLWKEELGDKWKDVYAIIPSIWPVSAINPRFQVLSRLMSPEQAKNQVFLLEGVGDTNSVRTVLGKIINDRAAAQLILGSKSRKKQELAFSLSSKQDLLSNDAEDAIDKFCFKNAQYC